MSEIVKRSDKLPANVLKDSVIIRLLEADKALAQATTVQQVKLVADVASAMEILAHRQKLGDDIQAKAHEIETYAMAKLGSLTNVMPKNRGAEGVGKSKSAVPSEYRTQAASYADLGLDKKVVSRAQQLANLDVIALQEIATGEKTLAQVKRERVKVEVRKSAELPTAKYRVIYADPPWKYNDKADAGSVQSGGAEHHYPSMSIAELSDLPVSELCEPNAVLFLWVTSPLLFESSELLKAWGFSYRASFVWDKVAHNMGHYNSVRHEFLLVCVRGSCQPDVVKLFDSVQVIERTEHSRKPEEFRHIIDTLYTHGKRIELFARRAADGWDCWGNEAPIGATA